jgi:hypothetical protein
MDKTTYMIEKEVNLVECRIDNNGRAEHILLSKSLKTLQFATLNQAQAYLDDHHADMEKPWEGIKAA